MTTSAVPVRSTRIRILAVVGALALGLGLVPAQAAFADPTTGTFSGTITDATTGAPLPCAYVSAQGGTTAVSTTTDEQGGFVLAGLPFGTYFLSVSAPGHIRFWNGGYEISEAAPELVVALAVQPLPTGDGTVAGFITNQMTGLGIPGIEVTLQADDLSSNPFTITDADGGYSFTDVASGGYRVFASTWNLPYQGYWGDTHVTVTDDAPDRTLNIALVPYASGTAVLSGVVTNAQTGAPVDGAGVSIIGADVVYEGHTTTSSTGEFVFDGLGGGSYFVGVWADGLAGPGQTIVVPADGTAIADFVLLPLNAGVHGRVTDADGNGIPGLWVTAGSDVGMSRDAYTDADGYYSILGLAAGVGFVSVGAGSPWVEESATSTFLMDDVVTQDFELEFRSTSRVMGITYAPDYTDAFPDICVSLLDATTAAVVATTTSWLDATFYFEAVETGSYTLQFKDCDSTRVPQRASVYLGGAHTFAEAEVFSIEHAADDQQHDVFLEPVTSGSITIAVTDSASGATIAGATATYTDAGGAHPVVDGDGDGVIALADLPFGDYVVTVAAPGYLSSILAPITIDPGDPDAEAAARLVGLTVDDGDGHDHGQGHAQHGRGHGYGHDKH